MPPERLPYVSPMTPDNPTKIEVSNGIEAGFYRHLERRLFEMSSLFDVSKALNMALNLSAVFETILLSAMGKFACQRGAVLLKDDDRFFSLQAMRGCFSGLHPGDRFPMDELPQEFFIVEQTDTRFPFFTTHGLQISCPILKNGESIGLLCLGKSYDRYFDRLDLDFIKTMTDMASTAIVNAQVYEKLKAVNRQLDLTIHELNSLFEISNELNSGLEAQHVMQVLTLTLMGQMMISKCFVVVADDERGTNTRLGIQRGLDPGKLNKQVIADVQFQELIPKLDDVVYTEDLERSRIRELCQSLNIAVLIPMQIKHQTKGILGISRKFTQLAREPFTDNELVYLTTLANQAMVALENARLFEVAIDKERLEKELDLAKTIQQGLLPQENPYAPNFDISGMNISSRQVGGDYFDFIKLPGGKWGIAIADVTGKGVPASLLMANVHAYLQILAETIPAVSDVTKKLNSSLVASTAGNSQFVTFFYGVLDPNTKRFTFTNAGHNYPIVFRRNGQIEYLKAGGLILGMFPLAEYEQDSIILESGDILLMYTDGVSEALDRNDEDYGEERIEQFIPQYADKPAADIIEILLNDLNQFTAGEPQSDDITVVLVKAL